MTDTQKFIDDARIDYYAADESTPWLGQALDRLEKLAAENERYKEGAVKALLSDAKIAVQDYARIGDDGILVQTPLAGVLAEWAYIDIGDAENFVTQELTVSKEGGEEKFVITIRRANGKTPEEKYIDVAAENARLRGDSEALRLLREMNMNRHGGIYDLGVTILDGETTWMLFDAKDPFEPFSQGDTPLEAILKAKSAIEHEQEEA